MDKDDSLAERPLREDSSPSWVPHAELLVDVYVKVLLDRSNRCSLYSMGPSCFSGSSLVVFVLFLSREPSLLPSPAICGVELPGVDHGECTRCGSSWYVNMEAITLLFLDCPLGYVFVHLKRRKCAAVHKGRVLVWEK